MAAADDSGQKTGQTVSQKGAVLEKLAENKCLGGRQLYYRHDLSSLGCAMRFSIFLPPQLEGGEASSDVESVPVLYGLSGLTCTDENFVHKAGVQPFAAKYGVAIVAQGLRAGGVGADPAYAVGLRP